MEELLPRPRLTEDEKVTMRERILDAAVHILHEHGPDSLSIRAIADVIGVSHMVLYTYFENRDALFAALRDRHSRKIQERHEEFLSRTEEENLLDVMRDMLDEYMQFARCKPRAFRFLWSTLLGEAEQGLPPPHEGLSEELRYLTMLIQAGMDKGCFSVSNSQTAALVIMGQLTGIQLLLQLPDTFEAGTVDYIEAEAINAVMAYLTDQRK